MNVWTDIALANIRRRPVVELFTCKGPCGGQKPERDFYSKVGRDGVRYRQPLCKVCQLARDRIRAAARAKAGLP